MNKGIIYIMTTALDGIIKIGKTATSNFQERMRYLETNGYFNINCLKRFYAIEVDDYEAKEKLLHDVFSNERVGKSELFVVEKSLISELLSSFDGKQIYPQKKKEETFQEASEQREAKTLPDATFYLSHEVKNFGKTSGTMTIKDGVLTVLKGAKCAPITHPNFLTREISDIRDSLIISNELTADCNVSSPSAASFLIVGKSTNGWTEWKDKSGKLLDDYRKHNS